MATWILDVDETGDFSEGNVGYGVVGVLTSVERRQQFVGRVRATWQREMPEVPWPPHATVLRQPLAWAIWGQTSAEPQLRVASLKVDQALQGDSVWRSLRKDLDRATRGNETQHRHCIAKVAQTVPQALDVLEQRSAKALDLQTQILRRVAEQCQSLVVTASPASSTAVSTADRYLALLTTLIRRAADCVLALPDHGQHELRVSAQQRGVVDPVLGPGIPMHIRHLGTACEHAAQSTQRVIRKDCGSVRLVPHAVPIFLAAGEDWEVLADGAANRLYRIFQQPEQSLLRWCDGIAAASLLPCRASPARLPLTASDGVPERLVEIARKKGSLSESHQELGALSNYAWAREQAGEWVDFLSGKGDR